MLLLTATGAVGATGQQFSGWPLHRESLQARARCGKPAAYYEPEAADSDSGDITLSGKMNSLPSGNFRRRLRYLLQVMKGSHCSSNFSCLARAYCTSCTTLAELER